MKFKTKRITKTGKNFAEIEAREKECCKAVVKLMNKCKKLELKAKGFQYDRELVKFVNENDIEIVAITVKGKFEGEGYNLFYYENI